MWSPLAQSQAEHLYQDGFEYSRPVLYPPDQVHSPISADVVHHWLSTMGSGESIQDDVFAKAGDTKLVSANALHCFAGANVDLGTHSQLQGTLNYFLAGDAAASTPFDRDSLATQVGRTASWLVGGAPSPLAQEFTAIWPRVVLIAVGESDMALMNLDLFANSLLDAIDYTLQGGAIPVIYSTVPCQACFGGTTNVDLYRRVARAVAQYRQVPFVDLFLALDPLPDHGLTVDGVNMNVYNPGSLLPCHLTADGLQFGYNSFNLISLQVLDRLRSVLLLGMSAPDPDAPKRVGAGTVASPIVVHDFPYGDGYDTRRQVFDEVNSFSGCAEDGDTQGPEVVFELQFDSPTSLEANLISRNGADLDIWLFDGDTSGANCVIKAHTTLEAEVGPGVWYLVVEAFFDGADLLSGEFVLSIDAQ